MKSHNLKHELNFPLFCSSSLLQENATARAPNDGQRLHGDEKFNSFN